MRDALDAGNSGAVPVEILDTTLRDGAQTYGISYSVEDKIKVLRCLDGLGVMYVEAGNPGSNKKDCEFFARAAALQLTRARLVAFGSTRKPGVRARDDYSLQAVAASGAQTASIVGKAWDFHVRVVLGTDNATNLRMIESSVDFLVGKGMEVLFDAEHFFDGYRADPKYAMACLKAAREAGARALVLCDTNGGMLPSGVSRAVADVVERFGGGGSGNGIGRAVGSGGGGDAAAAACAAVVGVHAHNDGGLAVANTIAALEAGATHAQGAVNGYGERCGNADLCAVIANSELKLGRPCLLPGGGVAGLSSASRQIAEIANMPPDGRAPYVGAHAFAHKGGMHVDGVDKAPQSFEHVDPERVGNSRRFLMSEVAGRGALVRMVQKIDPAARKNDPVVARAASRLKELEFEGYQYEGAEASLELELMKLMGRHRPCFELVEFKAIVDEPHVSRKGASALIKIRVHGQEEITADEGSGPVEALDRAIRKAVERFYPEVARMKLVDYKVRVIDSGAATAAKVRVLVESTDGERTWTTIGVSEDIILASWRALVDSIEFFLGGP